MPEEEMEIALQQNKDLPAAHEIVENDIVLEKFRKGELLMHVVEPPGVQKGAEGPEIDYSTWDYKLDLMNSEEGMNSTSTTLVMEGTPIELYVRPIGFIFDAAQAKIDNVALRDSIGGASATDLNTLDELRDYYKSHSGANYYNEVVSTTKTADVLGLVVRKGVKAASTLAGLEAVRKHLITKGLELRTYEYDEHTGSLEVFQSPNRDELLNGLRSPNKEIYEKVL